MKDCRLTAFVFRGLLALSVSIFHPAHAQTTITIHELQGSGTASPYVGQEVQVEGIVTALVSNGCYVQMPDAEADEDLLTSEGVLVYTGSMPAVSTGDRVRVTGVVSEYFDLTEIGDNPDIDVLSSGNPLPSPIVLDDSFPSPDQPWPGTDLERVEGMLVSINSGTLCSGLDAFEKAFVTASSSRSLREKGILYPGLSGLPVWDGNPEVFQMLPGLPEMAVVGGRTITNAWGPLSYSYGEYLLIASHCDLAPGTFPAAVRERMAGEVTLATQNLHQFDRDAAGYNRRLNKVSGVIRNLMHAPDIIGFQEVSSGDELNDIADQLRVDDPSLSYTVQYLPPDFGMGTGYLVKDGVTVHELIQVQAGETFSFNSSTYTLHDRPPLLMTCDLDLYGIPTTVTVILVHMRSMNGIEDSGDGPFVREKRYQQSRRLSQFLADFQTLHPDRPVFVLGDFNAFPFTDGYVDVMGQLTGNPDPAGAMVPATDELDPDLLNLMDRLPGDDRYTYVHEGTAQVFDQVLATGPGDALVRDVAVVHHSADAPEGLETDDSTDAGLSDHDGVIVYLGATLVPEIQSVDVDEQYQVLITAQDPDGGTIEAYRWRWSLGLTSETWTNSGAYTLPFTESGSYSVSVTAMDDEGQLSDPYTFDVAVEHDASITRPVPLAGNVGVYDPMDYLINTGEHPLSITLVPHMDGVAGEAVDVAVPAGAKFRLNDGSLLPEETDLLLLNTNAVLPVLCELTSGSARMTAMLDVESARLLYVPHIAEEVNYWDTSVFLSVADPSDPVIQVPAGDTLPVTNPDALLELEGLLPDPIAVATSWALATDTASSLSGMELFVKTGNDGAATELVSRPSQYLYIPHIPTETEIFWTGFALLNTGDETATLTFSFYGGSGELLGSHELTIPARSKAKGLMADMFPDVAGVAQWGTILADQPVIGIELYGTYHAGICGFTLPDVSRTDLVLPSMWAGEGLWTGVAATNPGTADAAVTVQLVAADGTIKAERQETLAARRRLAFVVADYFDSVAVGTTDYVRIRSTEPLTAIEAAGDLDRTFMTGLAAGR